MFYFTKRSYVVIVTILCGAGNIGIHGCRSFPAEQTSRTVASQIDPIDRSRNSRSDLPEFVMTKELPDVTRRLTNYLNTCWLQAGLKELEFAQYKSSGKAIALSAEHMMMSALHERFFRIIQGAKVQSAELEAGGEMNEVRQLAKLYGVVPEATWSQRSNDWGTMAKQLNIIGAEYRQKFRDDNKAGRDTKPLIADAEKQFQAVLAKFNVHQPRWFMHNGQQTSPVEFAKRFTREEPEDYIIFLAKQHHPTKPTKADLYTVQDGFVTSWENIEKTILHEINQKRSVLLSIYWSDKGIKITNGIMKVVTKPLTGHLDGHVVNIVGYHLTENGRIDRVKIENTWGRYEGSSGFYSVPWDDLKELYIGVSIPDGFNFISSQNMRGEKVLD